VQAHGPDEQLGRRYDVFISYARVDNEFVESLTRRSRRGEPRRAADVAVEDAPVVEHHATPNQVFADLLDAGLELALGTIDDSYETRAPSGSGRRARAACAGRPRGQSPGASRIAVLCRAS
jgi:hypothetical protein